MSTSGPDPAVLSAAQRVAGAVAARGRGDIDGARELMTSFESQEELASGALLVAGQTEAALIFLLLTAALWLTHRANIARLMRREEGRIGQKS